MSADTANKYLPAVAAEQEEEAKCATVAHLLEDRFLQGRPYDKEWTIAGAQMALRTHLHSGIDLGMHILLLKEREDHGDFMKAVARIGLPHRTATRYANRAAQVLKNPGLAKLATLQGGRMDQLVALDSHLEAIVDEDGRIAGYGPEELRGMDGDRFSSVLTSALAEAQDAVDAANARADLAEKTVANERIGRQNAQDQLKELKSAGNPKAPGSDYPVSVVRARMESSALSDQAIACLQSIEQLVRGIQTATDLGGETLERQANIKAAITPLALNAMAVGGVLDELLGYLKDHFGTYLPQGAEDTPLFSDKERKRVRAMRETMLELLASDKKSRDNAREISGQQKRGPGRPKKQ